jgi:hypothetical protein
MTQAAHPPGRVRGTHDPIPIRTESPTTTITRRFVPPIQPSVLNRRVFDIRVADGAL